MKRAPFRLRWFCYWLFTGTPHPENVQFYKDLWNKERRPLP